ncbi:hypothetical protein HanHA300_Chr03g0109181 [Helianthus annuus]|nr:hypothetical protein HanHA300_Chr03g0109181 [Helianthus annuus]KAJ0609536.1 hypothetical protein HanHA89_Chr03g0121061 [Helianthus annuus]KAJ0769583.1 hypothetical protein HanLR1_Chr03g0114371 [Helianthus annuus]KAJ0775310.1 hypothetical protein HanOQP8_Chr03g0121531 [Helianthus annuus]
MKGFNERADEFAFGETGGFTGVSWPDFRPHPPSLLCPENEEEILKKLKKHNTSAPTNSPLAVALSLSSIVVDSSRTSTVFGLRVTKTLMSFQVFNVGGSSKSSRLESRECINKLPVSYRKCVDKLPLNISSPLSYAREIL